MDNRGVSPRILASRLWIHGRLAPRSFPSHQRARRIDRDGGYLREGTGVWFPVAADPLVRYALPGCSRTELESKCLGGLSKSLSLRCRFPRPRVASRHDSASALAYGARGQSVRSAAGSKGLVSVLGDASHESALVFRPAPLRLRECRASRRRSPRLKLSVVLRRLVRAQSHVVVPQYGPQFSVRSRFYRRRLRGSRGRLRKAVNPRTPPWSAAARRRCLPSGLARTCCTRAPSPRISRRKDHWWRGFWPGLNATVSSDAA